MNVKRERAVRHSLHGDGPLDAGGDLRLIVDRSCIGKAIDRGRSDLPLMDDLDFSIAPEGRRAAIVVADGMGSTDFGEVASRIATRWISGRFETAFMESQPGDYMDLLQKSFDEANEQVWSAPAKGVGKRGMASTVVAAVIADGTMCFGHAGDSRAFLFRKGRVKRLTQDHLVAVLDKGWSDVGLKSDPKARDEDVAIARYHYIGEDQVKATFRSLPVFDGDIIVLATDGVTEVVMEDEMWRIVIAKGPTAAAESLVRQAIDNGSMDHCSAIVVKLSSVR